MKADFVKGHCGWDVVTLLLDGQIPAEQELSAALKILSAPTGGGLEVGWMGAGEQPGTIRLRMVSSTAKTWIPMCGGMTQVIGKALLETFLRDHFGIDVSQSTVAVTLLTPSGEIPLRIDVRDGKADRVTTVMDNYLLHVYRSGIERLTLCGIPLLRVGKYAVIAMTALEQAHIGVDFTRRDPGPHLEIVNALLRAFADHMNVGGVNGMLYDQRPEGPGQYRVFPRFYSEDLAAAGNRWEFQCGTGSVAVALALAHTKQLPFATGTGSVLFEWGSHRTTPDPYGIRISKLDLSLTGTHVTQAAFGHSVIEILAEGTLTVPNYLQQ
jgi:hypothetical protein